MTPKEIRDELIDIAGRTHDKALDERVRRLADKVCPPEKALTADIAMNTVEALVCAHCERDCVPTAPCKGHKPMFDIIRTALAKPTLSREQVEDALPREWFVSEKAVDGIFERLVGTPLLERKEVDDEESWKMAIDIADAQDKSRSHQWAYFVKLGIDKGMSLVAKPKEVSDDEVGRIAIKCWNSMHTACHDASCIYKNVDTGTIETAILEALALQGTKVAERIATT